MYFLELNIKILSFIILITALSSVGIKCQQIGVGNSYGEVKSHLTYNLNKTNQVNLIEYGSDYGLRYISMGDRVIYYFDENSKCIGVCSSGYSEESTEQIYEWSLVMIKKGEWLSDTKDGSLYNYNDSLHLLEFHDDGLAVYTEGTHDFFVKIGILR